MKFKRGFIKPLFFIVTSVLFAMITKLAVRFRCYVIFVRYDRDPRIN